MSLSSSALPSWVIPGFHAPAGRRRMASSSAAMMVQPQVNSSFFLGVDRDSRWVMRSWLAPAPSTRTRTLRRNRAGTCFRAAASTSLWSVNVFDPALPGLSSMCRHSRVLAHQAASGWKPYPIFFSELRGSRWCLGGHAEVDGAAAVGDLVELGEFVPGPGGADL